MKNTKIKDIKEIKDLTPCYQALFSYYQSARNKSSGKILYNVEANKSLADLSIFLEQKFKRWRNIKKKKSSQENSESSHWYVPEDNDKYCCKAEVIAMTKINVIRQIRLAVVSPNSVALAQKSNEELIAILHNIFIKMAISALRQDNAHKRKYMPIPDNKNSEKNNEKMSWQLRESMPIPENLFNPNEIGLYTSIQARSIFSKWSSVGEKLIGKKLLINGAEVKFSKNHNLVWQELLIEQQNGMPHVSNDPDQSLHIAKKLNADDASTSRWLKQVIEFLARHDDTEHLRTEMQDLFIRKGDYYRGDSSIEESTPGRASSLTASHKKGEINDSYKHVLDEVENKQLSKKYDHDEDHQLLGTKKVEQ